MKRAKSCLLLLAQGTAILCALLLARHWWANRQPTLNLPRPLPTPSPNGFDLYFTAARTIKPGDIPVDAIYDRSTFELTEQQKKLRYSLQRREAWVKQNADGFALFEQAKRLQTRHPNQRGLRAQSTYPYKQLRDLAHYKVTQANTFKLQKQWGKAANACLDVLEMSRDIQQGAHLIGGLVCFALEGTALRAFEDIPPHLNAQQCQQVSQRLESLLNTRPKFSEILKEDKYAVQSTMLSEWAKLDAKRGTSSLPSVIELIGSLVWTRNSILTGNERLMNDFIAQVDKPLLLQLPVAAPSRYFDSPNFILYGPLQRAGFNSARSLGEPRLQLLRVALRAYYLEKGDYPASLSQLVPQYVQKLPIDPYGKGETFHYRKLKKSYRLWSIGPDGIDNGGNPVKPKAGRKNIIISIDSKGDIVKRP